MAIISLREFLVLKSVKIKSARESTRTNVGVTRHPSIPTPSWHFHYSLAKRMGDFNREAPD